MDLLNCSSSLGSDKDEGCAAKWRKFKIIVTNNNASSRRENREQFTIFTYKENPSEMFFSPPFALGRAAFSERSLYKKLNSLALFDYTSWSSIAGGGGVKQVRRVNLPLFSFNRHKNKYSFISLY